MIVHFVRHGETGTRGVLNGRRSDPPASREGDAAAIRQIESLRPDLLVASPLLRCRIAAEVASKRLRIPLQVNAAWAEYDFGDWDGRLLSDLRAEFPDQLDAFYDDPERHPAPNGEAWADFRERIVTALMLLEQREHERRVVVVTHGGVMRGILRFALGFSFRDTWAVALDYATVMSVSYDSDTGGRLWGQLVGLYPATSCVD